jgi:hypothetical protein
MHSLLRGITMLQATPTTCQQTALPEMAQYTAATFAAMNVANADELACRA